MASQLWQDLRFALRILAKSPAFAAVAILSLALGIGANTALFSLMDGMLLRDLPVRNPRELVEFVRADPGGAMMTNLPYPVFARFEQDRSVLSDVFAFRSSTLAFGSERVTAHTVSGAFFRALGVNPLLGRAIVPDDDWPVAMNHVAVLSHAFWIRRLNGDPSILGAKVHLSGETFTVLGVMPPDFFGVDRSELPDIWVPLSAVRRPGQVWVLARLRPGVSAAQAQLQLDPLFQQALADAAVGPHRLLVNSAAQGTSILRWQYWKGSGALKILLGLTAMILLIACMNLANLLVARSAVRSREIGIRLAVGAGRWRIVRQLLTENLVLAILGGGLGLLFAAWGHRVIIGFLFADPAGAALDFRLDYRVLGAGLVLSVATSLLFGLIPAMRASSARSTGKGIPLAKGLLAFQVALSMVLLFGAGLSVRSLRNLGAVDLGFSRNDLLLAKVRPAESAPGLRQRVSQIPGVKSVALAGDAVFGNGGWNQSLWIERPGRPAQAVHVSDNHVSAGFFATVGIPILAGRDFTEQDSQQAPLVALVNQTFASRYFAGEDPLGKHFGDRGPDSAGRITVVGVVGDAKYGTVRERMRPMVFHPLTQDPPMDSLVLHVRSIGTPAALAPPIRREAAVTDVRTLTEAIHSQLRQDRMFATLAGFFAVLALVLGMIGIYGIVAYRVAHRTAEIGIRVALGARRGDVLWLVMRETLFLLAVGAVIGVPAALGTARLIQRLLFGLDPSDPVTLASAILALAIAAGLAAWVPARRAASVEPTLALRHQ
jgi:predicted permease